MNTSRSNLGECRPRPWFDIERGLFRTGSPGPRNKTIDGVTYKVAECWEEREAAFRLVYDSYIAAGLMEPNPYKLRVTPFHLLPTTDVLIAERQGEVVCTVSLIGDGDRGLPLEAIYTEEVAALRAQGIRLAESSCLAECRREPGKFLPVFINLVGLLMQFARANAVDRLLIAVHPRHERFYRRVLGFQRIGPERVYPSVCDKPAVAASHDFARLDEQRYPLYDQIYSLHYKPIELLPQPMTAREREYFSPAAELCDGYIPVAA